MSAPKFCAGHQGQAHFTKYNDAQDLRELGCLMCGLIAILARHDGADFRSVTRRMGDLLAHRGPDDSGYFFDHPLYLGFKRLAILDLSSAAHQPMVSQDGRYVIAFNGAIFNYEALREELTAAGFSFRSNGDTEVLLAAYQRWGRDCVSRLNGMWAFVIWDRLERRLFGSRDRFGEKPLFVRATEKYVAFASEIKALREAALGSTEIDPNMLASFLYDGVLDSTEDTMFRGIRRIAPGSAFEVDELGGIRSWSYWTLLAASEGISVEANPTEQYRELFEDSVRIRMRSDVPIGVSLSGGLDSTSIACAVARQLAPDGRHESDLRAFSFQAAGYDESCFIADTTAQTLATLLPVTARPRELWAQLEEHIWFQDEPVHTIASLVGGAISRCAKANGVKVLLNGQGADELLAGYPSFIVDYWSELLRFGHIKQFVCEVRKYNITRPDLAPRQAYRTIRDVLMRLSRYFPGAQALYRAVGASGAPDNPWISERWRQSWIRRKSEECSTLKDALLYSVQRSALPLYLRLEDRNSMSSGVETRLPFLDHRLAALSIRLPAGSKISGARDKRVLRDAMRGQIPESVRSRTVKFGFSLPIDQWFREELADPMGDLLNSQAFRESGLWNPRNVHRDFERHRRGQIDVGARLFDVAQTLIWLRFAASPSVRSR